MCNDQEEIRDLVYECVLTHNEEVLIEWIDQLQTKYNQICRICTDDKYTEQWTHEEVLDHITFNR
jgi:hypothetical protein